MARVARGRTGPFAVLLSLAALGAACSGFPAVDDGIVALEIRVPAVDTLVNGDTLALQARALNMSGDSVADAVIIWQTADTALISIPDATKGIVIAHSDTGTALVQASVGTLHSDPISILLRPDTGTTTSGSIRP